MLDTPRALVGLAEQIVERPHGLSARVSLSYFTIFDRHWVLLATLAAATTRIRLGKMVIAAPTITHYSLLGLPPMWTA